MFSGSYGHTGVQVRYSEEMLRGACSLVASMERWRGLIGVGQRPTYWPRHESCRPSWLVLVRHRPVGYLLYHTYPQHGDDK